MFRLETCPTRSIIFLILGIILSKFSLFFLKFFISECNFSVCCYIILAFSSSSSPDYCFIAPLLNHSFSSSLSHSNFSRYLASYFFSLSRRVRFASCSSSFILISSFSLYISISFVLRVYNDSYSFCSLALSCCFSTLALCSFALFSF